MSVVDFTREDVEAAAEVAPWERRERFSAEIDPEAMGTTAVRYARAAAETGSAADLARLAGELAEDAGARDGETLVDADARRAETARLREEEENAERVAHYLAKAMHLAAVTDDEVRRIVREELNPELARRQAAARREADELTSRNTYADRGDYLQALGAVRDRHVSALVEPAQRAFRRIDEEITAYRRRLNEYGAELSELKYDIKGGPVRLWSSPDMARWNAQTLDALLTQETKDRSPAWILSQLPQLTEMLGAIRADVFPGGGAQGPARRLTDAEAAYLEEFFAALSPDALVALGKLRAGDGDDDWAGDEAADGHARGTNRALAAVADGLQMLRNLDVREADLGRPHVIDSTHAVGTFVNPYYGPLFEEDPHSDAFHRELRRFNAFGALLGAATVPGGQAADAQLADTAVAVQERAAEQRESVDGFLWFDREPETVVENTGSADLLAVAAADPDAAAAQLANPDFADRLLRQDWDDDGEAAAGFVRAGIAGGGVASDAARESLAALFAADPGLAAEGTVLRRALDALGRDPVAA